MAISTVLKLKGRYPLRPVGVTIFRKLEKISKSLENTLMFVKSDELFFLNKTLKRISVLSYEASCIEAIFGIIGKIASLISKNYISEIEARKTLEKYVLSLVDSRDVVNEWIYRLQNKISRWSPKIFRYISFPFLPTTNNDLEAFNLKIKKLYRHTTGRKNSHRFLFSCGVPAAYALSSSTLDVSVASCAEFSHRKISQQKELLFDLKKKSLEYKIKTNLSDFLFELEEISSS